MPTAEYTYTRDPEISEGGNEVFTYTYVDGDGDTVSATLTITVPDINSVPEILSSENLTVDEDGLLAIRNDDEGQINPTESNNGGNATDSGEITVAYGNDQPANLGDAITFINPAALNGQLTQGGLPITFSIDGSGNLIGQVNGVGPAVVTIAFTTVSETNGIVTYGYQVTLSGQVDQAYPNGDQTEAGITLTGVQFQVTDSDGETDTSSFNVTIFDDVPSADDFEVTQDAEDQGSPVVVDITVGLEEGADGVDLNDVTWEVTSGIEANLSFDPTTGEFTYDPDNSETGDVIFTYTVVDGDGDEITQTVTIHLASDTAPSIESVDNVIVDEDGLAGIANEDEAGLQDDPEELDANEDADVTGEIEVDYGNDLPADVDGAIALVDNGSLDNQLVSLDGDPILFTLEGGELVGRADTDGDDIGDSAPLVVISLVAGATTDGTTVTYTYRVQLLGPIGHPEGDDIETEVTLTGVDFVVTDSDGTETAGSFDVDIFDDVPSADDFEVTQDAEDQGSPVVVDITVGLEEGADGVDLNDVTWEVTSGIEANLSFDPTTGEFTYDPDNSETGDVIFTYTVVDGDGDEITQTVTIHLASDTAPSIESVDNVIVDEDGLAGIANEDEAGLQDDPEELDANEDADVTGEIEVDYGNDLPADVDGAIALVDNGSLDNQLVSLDGDPILFTLEGGELVGRADTDGDDIGDSAPLVVISLVAGATTDGTTVTYTYRVQLLGPIGHPEGDDIETEVTLTGVDFVVTDSDGTETAGSFDVDIFDDVPSATDEAEQNVGEGDTATGTFDFVEGADGASVTHVNGTVLVFDEVTGWSQQVNLGSGSSIIVKADGSYEFTAGDPTLGTPSITGTFTVTDGDGDQVEADFEFDVADEYGPTASSPTAWVDDDGFPTGNPDSIDGDHADDDLDGDGDETTYSGNLVTSFGGDLAGSVNFADMDGNSEAIGQETVTYSWNALTNTLTATITASPDDTRENTTLFEVVVTPSTGAYTVTLEQNVLHAPPGTNTENDATVTLDYEVLDSDGTSANGVLTLNFDDDIPTDFTPEAAVAENTGGDVVSGFLDLDETLDDNIGADRPASLVFDIPDDEDGTPLLNTDDVAITVGGSPVLLFLEDDGSITATTDRDDPNATVFVATLDLATSSYEITFSKPLDNGSTSASDFTGAAAGNQDWIGIDPDLFGDPPAALDIEDTDDPNPEIGRFAHHRVRARRSRT